MNESNTTTKPTDPKTTAEIVKEAVEEVAKQPVYSGTTYGKEWKGML